MALTHDHPILTTIAGMLVGLAIGAVVAVNIVIYSGIDRGYEATPGEVFSQKPIVGILAVAALIAGPLIGAYLARRTSGH